jgi:hypothetical protein
MAVFETIPLWTGMGQRPLLNHGMGYAGGLVRKCTGGSTGSSEGHCRPLRSARVNRLLAPAEVGDRWPGSRLDQRGIAKETVAEDVRPDGHASFVVGCELAEPPWSGLARHELQSPSAQIASAPARTFRRPRARRDTPAMSRPKSILGLRLPATSNNVRQLACPTSRRAPRVLVRWDVGNRGGEMHVPPFRV